MNEPKKRGRPAKAQPAADQAASDRVEFTQDSQPLTEASLEAALEKVWDQPTGAEAFARRQAQAYARRVWDGQSRDLSRDERLGRVRRALEAQGMSMEGVEL